jgi:Lactoylglutathione lyase and related lyases
MPKVNQVLETAIYVDDLERAEKFYDDLFGFPRLFSDWRACAYDVGGRSVLLLFLRSASLEAIPMGGDFIPPHDGNGRLHLAFAIERDELAPWIKMLAARNIPIESRVRWQRGGESIYFRDPDGHLLELVTPGCWAIY